MKLKNVINYATISTIRVEDIEKEQNSRKEAEGKKNST